MIYLLLKYPSPHSQLSLGCYSDEYYLGNNHKGAEPAALETNCPERDTGSEVWPTERCLFRKIGSNVVHVKEHRKEGRINNLRGGKLESLSVRNAPRNFSIF